jgi:hypothetical protein
MRPVPRFRRILARVLAAILLAVIGQIGTPISQARGASGRLTGTVVDSRGESVADASVVVTSAETARVRETVTNRAGSYAAEFLPPGRYVVRVSAVGFATVVISDAIVRIAETTSLDCSLSPSLGNEVLTITAEAALIQSESSQLGRVVGLRELQGLPLPTRNYQQMLSLSAGTSAALPNTTELGRGDAAVSVNGQRTTSNNVRMNGVDANAIGGNATANLAVPSVDALREFIVQTGLYDASSGRGAGGSVEVATRSGSNTFHGGAYEFFRNGALNANDFFLNAAGRSRPVLDRNQFGAVLGGPVVEGKAFFFASYQGTRERNGASIANSLASPTIPPGLRDDNRSAEGLSAAFAVPIGEVSPVAVALLNARHPDGGFVIPSPSTPSGLTPLSSVSTFRENQYNANLDLTPSDRHALSMKWFSADNFTRQANATFGGLANGPTQLPGFGAEAELTNRLLSVAHTWAVGSSVVNQARFGVGRNELVSEPVEPFTAAELGISSPLASMFSGMPTIAVVGLFTLGSSVFADSGSASTTVTIADTLSVAAGSHLLRFGAEYRHNRAEATFRGYTRGQVVFPSFDAFLRGQTSSVIGSGVFDRSFRLRDFAWFVQDDFKVTSRLTLNLGLRHDYYGQPVEARGRFVNFLPEAFRAGVPGAHALPPNGFVQAGNATSPLPGVPLVDDSLVRNDWNNLAPRVGFAWSLTPGDRLVVRGGYGIYYDRVSARWALFQAQAFPYYSLASAVGRPFDDPFEPVPLPSEFPVSPTIPSPLDTPINGNFIDPKFRTPVVQQYGVNLQA